MNPFRRFSLTAAAFVTPLGFGMLVEQTATAALIVYEPFDYADGGLRNQNGGEGEWENAWHQGQGFGSGDTWQVGQPGLGYTDSGGRTLPSSGGAARADDGGAGNMEFREARRWDTDGYIDDGDVLWFSFLFNRTSGNDSGNHIWILGDAGLPNGIGVFINPTTISARIQVNSVVNSSGAESFALGEDHFVVGRMTFSDSMDDEVRFWLDPELDAIPLDTAPNSGAVSASLNQAGRTGFYMRQFNSPGVTAIDEIRIGTDFFSVVGVTVIPEPSSILFVSIAALVSAFYRLVRSKLGNSFVRDF